MRKLPVCLIILVLSAASVLGQFTGADKKPVHGALMKTVARSVPSVTPDHPGNVFLLGEKVTFDGPAGAAKWQVTDDARKAVTEGAGAKVSAGALGIGWYRIDFTDADGKACGYTTAAVLAPPAVPVPQDSPICLDVASAWFGRGDPAKQERFAYLAVLAGANWARDRLGWNDAEPDRDQFAEHTTYDSSADALSKQGLKVLQVFHATPRWALTPSLERENAWRRFPRDLRDEYAFCKAMAARYKDRIMAWEPWNEANVPDFGGQTVDEMCSLQKAAYWGLKDGNPETVVCWNVFAGGGDRLQSEGVIRNEAWPYFETYDIHSYDAPERYLKVFERARDTASGRPIWLTECGIGLHFTPRSQVELGNEKDPGELDPQQEQAQAWFIAQSYASSLFAGVNRHFYFILGNYLENVNQFGVLRYDQTPRPAYVALAAVGRLLAGATPLGRIAPERKDGAFVYAFRARPDGTERDVLVAWSKQPAPNPVPPELKPLAVYDYIGRPCPAPAQLGPAATFLVLPARESRRLGLEPAPTLGAFRGGKPSPVVLQLVMPEEATNLGNQAHEVVAGQINTLPIIIYNFSSKAEIGRIRVETLPDAWHAEMDSGPMQLAPLERIEVPFKVTLPANASGKGDWVALRGEFGADGRPALAFRLMPKAKKAK